MNNKTGRNLQLPRIGHISALSVEGSFPCVKHLEASGACHLAHRFMRFSCNIRFKFRSCNQQNFDLKEKCW